MHAAQRGPEAHHVEVGIFLAEQAALQAGMYGEDFRLLAKQALVAFLGNLHDDAVGVHLPAGIALVGLHLCAAEAEGRADYFGHVLARAAHAAALARGYLHDAVEFVYARKV